MPGLDRRQRAVVHRVERATHAALGRDGPATLLLALSGGADSSAACLALTERGQRFGWTVVAAHLDHGLQPPAARAAMHAAAAGLAQRCGLRFLAESVDVAALAATEGRGLEVVAREERYRFLARSARRVGADAVVTGHTRDDQVETVLLAMIRGSGLDGLAGMRPRAPLPFAAPGDPPLLRPLLDISRAETEALCAAAAVIPAEDPSNRDRSIPRNRLRLDVAPVLRAINPGAGEAIHRLAGDIALDTETLEALAEAALAASAPEELADGAWRVARAALRAQPSAVRRRALRRLGARVGVAPLTHDRTLALDRVLERSGRRADLGAGATAASEGAWLVLRVR